MQVKFNEFRFYIFYIPIFFLKLLNITPSNKWFVLISILCFLFVIFSFYKEKMEKRKVIILTVLAFYSGLLVLTCGKKGPFFAAIIILALYGIENKRNIYKVLFWIGIIAVLVSCYLERNGAYGMRYINGEWASIYKRSNILYISFIAVICLYLFLQKNNSIRIRQIVILGIIGFAMFKYSGSRTGAVIMTLLLFLLFSFRFRLVQNNKIVKHLCILSPLLMLIVSCILVVGYGKHPIFTIVDNLIQGRLRLGCIYFDRYDISILGQHLYQSSSTTDFLNLDCAYYYMLLGYGLIYTILWIVSSCKLIKYLYMQKRYTEVSIMVMYSVYGLSETFLPNGFLNMSIFLYAEYLYYILEKRKLVIYEKNKNNCYVSSSVS